MNIAILGTRGVPNFYGGFEQLAEYLSIGLVERGHQVTVYNSHNHPYQQPSWNGVQISHQFDPEYKIGTAGQFIYDLNCILHSRKQQFDVVLQLGYTSSSIWRALFPKSPMIITNMDGLEWKRTKYGLWARNFLKVAERMAVQMSHELISDSLGIQKYLQNTYSLPSTYIPYGATVIQEKSAEVLKNFGLEPFGYDLLIARLEPENSIEIILDGYVASGSARPFVVIGGFNTPLGKTLAKRYASHNIKFLGAIYDINVLNNLRAFSNLYFHGHTVGGTNPSLLEAMASEALICAHDNDFNKSILAEDAFYFSSVQEVSQLLQEKRKEGAQLPKVEKNRNKINQLYTWESIIHRYEDCFIKALASRGKKHEAVQ